MLIACGSAGVECSLQDSTTTGLVGTEFCVLCMWTSLDGVLGLPALFGRRTFPGGVSEGYVAIRRG